MEEAIRLKNQGEEERVKGTHGKEQREEQRVEDRTIEKRG